MLDPPILLVLARFCGGFFFVLSLYSNFTSKKCHDQAHGKARLLKHIENISKPFFPSEELVNFSMGLEKSHTKALFFSF